jgi:hypothetical protein
MNGNEGEEAAELPLTAAKAFREQPQVNASGPVTA